jgi:hypothetical protein
MAILSRKCVRPVVDYGKPGEPEKEINLGHHGIQM